MSRHSFGWVLCLSLVGACFLADVVPVQTAALDKDTFPYSETIAEVSAYIAAVMNTNQIEGISIALMDHEDLAWSQGYGWADKADGLKVSADTTFHIGSVSKMLTTAAAMILVDEGKIDIDKPVTAYIPSFSLLSPGYGEITPAPALRIHGDFDRCGLPESYSFFSFTFLKQTWLW